MKEKLIEMIIYCLPAIIATLTCIFTCFKMLGGINNWKDSINDTNLKQLSKDCKAVVKRNLELNNQLVKVLAENEQLKEQLKTKLNDVVIEIENLKKEAEKNLEEEKEE